MGTDGSDLAMQGMMMKKKTSTPAILRPITLEYVTRHFFLYQDGKMIYSRDGASVKPEEMVLMCNSIKNCQIDRAKASDLGKKSHHVANSFYITVPLEDDSEFAKTHRRTLLVAHGPEDFKKWIAAFRRLDATVNIDVEEQGAVPQAASPAKAVAIPKEVSSDHSLEVSALRMSDAKFKDSGSSDDVKFKDSVSTVPAANVEEQQHVHFSSKEDEIVVLPETDNIRPGVRREKSVSFDESSMKEMIPHVENYNEDGAADPAPEGESGKRVRVSFSSTNDKVINNLASALERKPSGVSFSSENNEVINKESVVSFSSANTDEVVPVLERKHSAVSFSSERNEVINKDTVVSFSSDNDKVIGEVIASALEKQPSVVSFSSEKNEVIDDQAEPDAVPTLEKKPSVRFDAKPCDVIDISDVLAGEATADETTATDEQSEEEAADETATEDVPDPNEGVLYPTGCKGAKVFAYGDTLDELTKALTSKTVLYGIVTTSLEETMDDETYANTSSQQYISKMKAFSIEFLGKKADPIKAERFEQHLSEIISFCKSSSNINDLHPIRCGNGEKAKDEIISVLDVMEDVTEEETEEAPSSSPSKVAPNFYVNSSGLTAYKNALQTEDAADIPSGSQVLACVRDQKGIPYNWVLFQPSQTELIVEDAGSGGVTEMTQVLHQNYNDRVLFGLARVSFMGETFGRRQIWFGLEWSGENCTSVKMIRKLRDCALKMTEFIGDRSFTMTNVSADDMTPEAVCAWVKRSCDVTDYELSVDSMNAAYTEEQKVIKEYYEKLAEKEEAKRIAREAKRKEQLRKERLWLRQETRENMAPIREERREKWSKLVVPDILKDLGGKASISGWVLLEIDI